MSRCFPFPPPGYELKAKPDDVNSIIKVCGNDKQKHKKHKDKKEKDKKEESEREREKERSETKHKENKKRKRKEDKDKEDKTKKDKLSSLGVFLENQNGQKLVPDDVELGRVQENGNDTLATKGKRDHNGMVSGQSLSFSELDKVGKTKEGKESNGYRNTVQENGNDMLATKDKRDHNRMFNGGSLSFSELYKVEKTKEGKECNGYRNTVQENGNDMLATKDKRDHNRMVNGQSLIFSELDKVEKTEERKESNRYRNTVQENGKDMLAIKDKRDCNRMVNGQSLSFSELVKVEKTKEGKESNGHRNTVGDKDDSKNEDQIKITRLEDKKTKEEKDHNKNKKEEKKKMKEEKKKRKEEKRKRKEQKKKENIECQGKLPKLKELNDFLDAKENGVRPYDMSRPAIVSQQAGHTGGGFCPSQNTINLGVGERAVITDQKVNPKLSSPQSVIDGVKNIGLCQTANNRKTENGRVSVNNHVVSTGIISPHIVRIERKVEPYQTCNGVAMTKQIVNRSADGKIPFSHPFAESEGKTAIQALDAFHKMHKKESRMNGPLEGIKTSSSMPSSASLKGKEKVATTTKPPHPDLKYLSQILAVPEVEWPQCDEQEWLFDHKDSQAKRPKLASSETQWTKQVWSEAVELESADVTALPYVIPY